MQTSEAIAKQDLRRNSHTPESLADEAKPVSLRRLVGAVLAAAVIAAVVYGVSRSLPATYQASGTFRVTVPNQQGINDTVVTASNDLATQYSQLADAQPVLNDAAQALHVSASSLSGNITASTVAAQNVVQVTASASSPSVAAKRASAALSALVSYIQGVDVKQSQAYAKNVTNALRPVDRSIAQLTSQLNKGTPAQRQNTLVILSGLETQRQQALQSLATNTAGGRPSLQIVSPGGGAAAAYPKPSLYALIAFVVALLIGTRLAFVLGRTRRTSEAATLP